MDAVQFLKNFDRMCTTNASLLACDKCKASDCCLYGKSTNPEKLVKLVEEWAKEHPVKTRQDKFLEHYPKSMLNDAGRIDVCPLSVDKEYNLCRSFENCLVCKKQYWEEEIE